MYFDCAVLNFLFCYVFELSRTIVLRLGTDVLCLSRNGIISKQVYVPGRTGGNSVSVSSCPCAEVN